MPLIKALISMPYTFYFAFLGMLCFIYFAFIGPIIFRFWVIPGIEKRYKMSLKVNSYDYLAPFPNWLAPPMEASYFICCNYLSLHKIIPKKPRKGMLFDKLLKRKYEIKDATKFEIVMSLISVFLFICLFVSGAVVCLT